MAAATAADMAAGTRRAVVRSEKFMEWQRELSSSRAAYGGRRRYDDLEAVNSNGIKKHQRKRHSSDEEAAKGSEERDAEGEGPVAASQAEVHTAKAKLKKQQHQRQRSDSKRLQKELDPESKRVVQSKGKDTHDLVEGEGGRLRKCKQNGSQAGHSKRHQLDEQSQQTQQQTCPNQTINRRRQRQMPRADQELRSLKRATGSETPPPTDLPSSRGSKRSRRVAKRLAHEEPLPPPLKLPKLHLVLTRKEIQEDWIKITGHKYSGKPRKSTLVQLGLGLCTSLTCPSTIRYLNDPQ